MDPQPPPPGGRLRRWGKGAPEQPRLHEHRGTKVERDRDRQIPRSAPSVDALTRKNRARRARFNGRASTLATVSSEREVTEMPTRLDVSAIITAPGGGAPPGFDRGWLIDGDPVPFVSYVPRRSSVNWSADLEALHEESSRTHFLDRWTRGAILARRPLPPARRRRHRLLHWLSPRGSPERNPSATLIGVDLVAAGLGKAHGRCRARLLHADACRAAAAEAASRGRQRQPARARAGRPPGAARVRRVLRPGGRAVIVVPAGPSTYDYYDRFLGHERRYARHELASKCVAAGFETSTTATSAPCCIRRSGLSSSATGASIRRCAVRLWSAVASDIERTRDSRIGDLAWKAECGLAARASGSRSGSARL